MYLKKAEFNREPLYAKFRLREPFRRPILSAEPSISVHQLQSHDRFIIFASDGLWEHIGNQEAVDIVQNHPRNVRTSDYHYLHIQENAQRRLHMNFVWTKFNLGPVVQRKFTRMLLGHFSESYT